LQSAPTIFKARTNSIFPAYLLKTLLQIGYQPPSSQLPLRERALFAGSIAHPFTEP
jgi:hypothetical protein